MIRIVIVVILSYVSWQGQAQQELLYTQFMYNKLALNPGYAGSVDVVGFTAIYRNQWSGFPGAPETALASINVPLDGQKIGLGLNISTSSIGVTERFNIEGIYAYRLRLPTGMVSLGLQGSARRFTVDYSDPRLFAVHDLSQDAAIQDIRQTRTVMNFGFGVYYHTKRYYGGLSIPRLVKADIDFDDNLDQAKETRHLYAMAGMAFDLNSDVVFTPQILFKWAENAPFDLDLNGSFTYKGKYTAGLTYRSGGQQGRIAESIDIIFGLQVTKDILFGFAYDLTLSDIRKYENGSIEALIQYTWNKKEKAEDVINPRYF